MNNSNDRLFLSSHEWIEFIGEDIARIGISDFAQKQLGDLVFVNLPEVGDMITVGQPFADVESVKGVTDILSPVTARVSKINEKLLDAPQMINEDAFNAWFIEVEGISVRATLLDAATYAGYCVC